MNPSGWLILLLVFLGIELLTMGLTTIWFAGGAFVAFLLAMFDLSITVQVVVFVIVSLVLLMFTRPVALRYFNGSTVRTNVESLKGRRCMVLETIDNDRATGAVQLDGVVWSARSVDDEILEEGCLVCVERVRGVKVIVSRAKERKYGSVSE